MAVEKTKFRSAQQNTGARPLALICLGAVLLAGCDAWVGADKRVERAQAHLANGEFRPAMAQLKTALQDEPGHIAARLALAELSLWLGDVESAQKEFDRAVAAGASAEQTRALQYELLIAQERFDDAAGLAQKDEITPAVRLLVIESRILSGRGELEQAEEKIRLALQRAGDDPQALLEAARLAAKRGDDQLALELPDRLSAADETYARAMYLRGATLMSRGQHAQAREAFSGAQEAGKRLRAPEKLALAAARTEANLALNDVDAAEQTLASVAVWGPGSLAYHYLRARVAMQKQDYSLAVAECQRALGLAPQHGPTQLLLAAAHFSQGSLEQAQEALTRLLAANPQAMAARKLLAQVYLARSQPEQAQRVLNAAGAGDEPDQDTDWLMGAAMLRSGSISDGLQHMERSAAADPDNLARRVDLAGAYIAAGAPSKAVELLESIPPQADLAPRARSLLVLATAVGKPRAEARSEVEKLVAQHPDDAALISVAGAFLVQAGDPAGGRRLLERALQLDSAAVQPRIALARLDAARSPGEAEKRLLEILKLQPKHQLAHLTLSELAWVRGDRDASRKWLENAVSADPGALDARLRLAQMAFLKGDALRARSLLDQAVSVAANRKVALTGAGRVLARAGFGDEAIARFREAAAAGDDAATLEAARLHLELGQPGRARDLVESALNVRPGWLEAEQLLVTIEARDGRIGRAIERAKKLAGEGATPAALRSIEGDVYMVGGQPGSAAEAYAAAHALQPSAQSAVRLFRARRAAGAADAERSLKQWLERQPGDPDVRRVLAVHYESMGEYDRAIAEYERLLAAGRVDPSTLNNLAWLLHERNDPRAPDLAKRAYDAAPQIAEVADTYGWILVRMDKVAEGLAVLEQALARAPSNPDILYHVAFACSRSGQTKRAAELVGQSLQAQREFVSRAAAEQLQQSLRASSGT